MGCPDPGEKGSDEAVSILTLLWSWPVFMERWSWTQVSFGSKSHHEKQSGKNAQVYARQNCSDWFSE
jgi:hypothetical protein